MKDRRYYELIEDTLLGQFEHWYAVVEKGGETVAVQPLFFVDQDLVAAASPFIRRVAGVCRKALPRLLRLRLLMVGCAAGEGHLEFSDADHQRHTVKAVAEILPAFARQHGARMIVWKDFPTRYRAAFSKLEGSGEYLRVASMPATRLAIDFTNFDEYLAKHVSKVSRKSLRRKLKAAAEKGGNGLVMSVHDDVAEFANELHPLYLQVFAKSPLQFEQLTPEFLAELGRRMPDRARFFVWRLHGHPVAFSVCLQHCDVLSDEYIGLDYRVALDLHLYYLTIRDLFCWAAESGIRTYYSTPLNYEPKLHLGFHLAPLDLYVRAASDWLQPLIRLALPFVEPTRSEPVLRRFRTD
jgi:hypothetical protein